MGQIITCTRRGVYHLTRGRQYELLAHDETKKQVKVRGDNGRGRWYPAWNFDFSGGPVPVLTAWEFIEPVIDELNNWNETYNSVLVGLTFDDGTKRWCSLTTPDYAKYLVSFDSQPMLYGRNQIIVRDLFPKTVDFVFSELDQQGELLDLSQPVEPFDNAEYDSTKPRDTTESNA